MAGPNRKRFPTVIAGLCSVAMCLAAGTAVAQTEDLSGEPPEKEGVFRGELDVSIINLYVTAVDREGQVVPGLSREDFEILENGEVMEITNFSILEHGKRVVPETVDPEIQESSAEGAATEASTRHVAVLFDLLSLQKRNKDRVVEAIESLVKESLVDGDQILVAVNSGELEIIREFSSYEAALMAGLQAVGEIENSGDSVKSSKRMLKRTIHTTRFTVVVPVPFSSEVTVDEGYIRSQAGMLQTEINNMRQYEYQRIDQSIGVADELVRALAGIDGPKAVLWIGEDMAMRPAYDLYNVFYKKASFYQNILRLSHPELWSREMDLSRQFQRLAAAAQSCGATFHVIDASDRDREMGNADFGSPTIEDLVNSEAAGNSYTPGTDPTEFWDMTEGADYMALATGGSVQKNTRDLEGSVARIREQMVLTYSLGYQHPGAPDGQISRVQVRVKKPGVRVRHHERVLNKTGNQHLADLALSRVRFDIGGNQLGMSVLEGQPQPGEEGKIVRSIQVRVPVESLVLMPQGDVYAGELVTAVAVLDGNGRTAEPRLMRLSIAIPSDRYKPDAVAARTLRLLMAPDTRRVAIGVRDEVSGLTSTAAVELSVVEDSAEDSAD